MMVPPHIEDVEAALLRSSALLESGISPRMLAEGLRTGEFVRVARGWFVTGTTWKSWFAEKRHLASVIAAHHNAVRPPLFSHYSAAVLLGLPLWDLRPVRVHTISARDDKSNASVRRHHLEVPAEHTGDIAGYRCTNHARTLLDIASIAKAETVLGCADAVLARAARRGRVVDEEAWQRWVSDVTELIDSLPARSRGTGLARRVVAIADPRAESVLESVSRLQLIRLGFDVGLQIPVPSPSGGYYYMDFEMRGLKVFGECDGDIKYSDPVKLAGRSPAAIAIREKKRDNWTAGTTDYRLVHWGASNVGTAERLGRLLRSYHLPLPRLR